MKAIATITFSLACLAAAGANAQVTTRGSAAVIPPVTLEPRADSTTGTRAPATTGSLAPSGKVKPPGSALGNEDPKQAALDRRERELDRRIRTGICRGC